MRERPILTSLYAQGKAQSLRQAPGRSALVDAAVIADALGVSRDCVYTHATELGGKRIGGGPRGRLRFDLDQTLAAWTSRSTSKESQQPKMPTTKGNPSRRRRQGMGSSAELLPIRVATVPLNVGRERS